MSGSMAPNAFSWTAGHAGRNVVAVPGVGAAAEKGVPQRPQLVHGQARQRSYLDRHAGGCSDGLIGGHRFPFRAWLECVHERFFQGRRQGQTRSLARDPTVPNFSATARQ